MLLMLEKTTVNSMENQRFVTEIENEALQNKIGGFKPDQELRCRICLETAFFRDLKNCRAENSVTAVSASKKIQLIRCSNLEHHPLRLLADFSQAKK
ncbi:hypothetical protein SLE2022_359690 [Rubroshorea leprosula]